MKDWTLLWFRKDLRVEDNPALQEALVLGNPILPIYILEDDEEPWGLGAATKWWLHHSLAKLQKELDAHNLHLCFARGNAEEIIFDLLEEHPIASLLWNRRYDRIGIERDSQIKKRAKDQGLLVKSFNGSLLFEPHTIKNKSGEPFKVFTPFWKACQKEEFAQPKTTDWTNKAGKNPIVELLSLDDLELLPNISWDTGFYEAWDPAADPLQLLKEFLDKRVETYKDDRNFPSIHGTSKLSPFLHFGQISPRQVVHEAKKNKSSDGLAHFLSEVGWREFAYHLLYHFPHTPEKALYNKYQDFPWDDNKELLTAWKKGQTGYPIVDAGMRELWQTGWMHNRVRMIVASFLVKHLLQPWQEGASWFWDTLVDADIANNTLGWQWSAGCGADAAPYFRIFNPITQGEKFDGEGTYITTYCPELKNLPKKFLFAPWEAPKEVLAHAGITLGKDYPTPIVDHKDARHKALEAFDQVKGN